MTTVNLYYVTMTTVNLYYVTMTKNYVYFHFYCIKNVQTIYYASIVHYITFLLKTIKLCRLRAF